MYGWEPRRLGFTERVIHGISEIDEASWAMLREPHDRLRRFVLSRDGHRCLVCDDTEDLQVDHFISWADGGLTIHENLLTLCGACNQRKGSLSGEPGLQRARAAFQRDPFRIFSR